MSKLLKEISQNKKLFKPVIYGIKGTSLNDDEKYFFSKNSCLGFILFARNIIDKKQVKKLLSRISCWLFHCLESKYSPLKNKTKLFIYLYKLYE